MRSALPERFEIFFCQDRVSDEHGEGDFGRILFRKRSLCHGIVKRLNNIVPNGIGAERKAVCLQRDRAQRNGIRAFYPRYCIILCGLRVRRAFDRVCVRTFARLCVKRDAEIVAKASADDGEGKSRRRIAERACRIRDLYRYGAGRYGIHAIANHDVIPFILAMTRDRVFTCVFSGRLFKLYGEHFVFGQPRRGISEGRGRISVNGSRVGNYDRDPRFFFGRVRLIGFRTAEYVRFPYYIVRNAAERRRIHARCDGNAVLRCKIFGGKKDRDGLLGTVCMTKNGFCTIGILRNII